MSRHRRNAAWVISAAVFAVAVHVAVAGGVAPQTKSAVPAPLTGTWGKKVSDATWHEYGIYYEIAGHWAIAITKGGVASLFTPPGQPKEAQPLTTMHAAATGGVGSLRADGGRLLPHERDVRMEAVSLDADVHRRQRRMRRKARPVDRWNVDAAVTHAGRATSWQ